MSFGKILGTLVVTPANGKVEFIPQSADSDMQGLRWEQLANPYRLIAFIKRFHVCLESVSSTMRAYEIDIERHDLTLWLGMNASAARVVVEMDEPDS